MTYDDWKTESPEDEHERLTRADRKRQERYMWEEEHFDYLREMRDERRNSRDED